MCDTSFLKTVHFSNFLSDPTKKRNSHLFSLSFSLIPGSYVNRAGHRDNDLLAKVKLPENFCFVLEYFCATVGLTAVEIMGDMARVEQEVRRMQPDFFGEEIKEF